MHMSVVKRFAAWMTTVYRKSITSGHGQLIIGCILSSDMIVDLYTQEEIKRKY